MKKLTRGEKQRALVVRKIIKRQLQKAVSGLQVPVLQHLDTMKTQAVVQELPELEVEDANEVAFMFPPEAT